jgi:hypothetical protein
MAGIAQCDRFRRLVSGVSSSNLSVIISGSVNHTIVIFWSYSKAQYARKRPQHRPMSIP